MSEVTLVAIDLAKQVFQLHGVDERGAVRLQRRLSRTQLMPALAQIPACTVAMEACASAHHWGRQLRTLGHRVRLLPPQHVKAFLRGQKNDRNDAAAIACAAVQAGMPEVALKSEAQQAVLAVHRIREGVIKQRVALVNQLHGIAAEFGLVLPRGLLRMRRALTQYLDEERFPAMLNRSLRQQLHHLLQLEQDLKRLTAELRDFARNHEPCQRLMRYPGVAELVASAFVCSLGEAHTFKNGRQVAAWLGLVPRQHSSGNRQRLLGITKRGNPYLRKLLVHGARAAMRVAARHEDPFSRWCLAVRERRGAHRAMVALANKLARHLWASLRYEQAAA